MTEMSAAEAATVARFDAAEPAPESWRGDDGLRQAIALALVTSDADVHGSHAWDECREELRGDYRRYADAVLALPEVAALRAKAAAADRVRELHVPLDRGTGPQCQGCATHVTFIHWPCPTIAALDGPPC